MTQTRHISLSPIYAGLVYIRLMRAILLCHPANLTQEVLHVDMVLRS